MAQLLPNSQPRRALSGRARLWIGLRIGFGVALIVLVLWWGNFFVQGRLRLTDLLIVPQDTGGQIVIVGIDDRSLAAYGRSTVDWSRSIHARLITALSDAGARVIAFDLLFDQPGTDDAALVDALTYARIETSARTRVVMPVVGAQRRSDDSTEFAYFLTPIPALSDLAAALGHTDMIPDADGTVRRLPAHIHSNNARYLSFGLVTYLTYLRIPPIAFDQVISFQEDTLTLPGGQDIPLGSNDTFMIRYFSAPNDQRFPIYSYQDVFEGRVDPALFDDKIVLVGVLPEARLGDVYRVPSWSGGQLMSGVEIHANLIETLLQNKPLREQSRLSQAVMIVVLTLLSSLFFTWASRRFWWFLFIGAWGIPLLWLVGVFVYFNLTHEIVNLFHSLLALLLPLPVVLVVTAVIESQRRERAELLLGSLVDASSQHLSLERILPGLAGDARRLARCPAEVEIWLWNQRAEQFYRAYPAPPADQVILPPEDRRARMGEISQAGTVCYEHGQIMVPLVWQKEPVGLLIAPCKEDLAPAQRQTLALFAWQSASVIANARLYEEVFNLSELRQRILRMVSHDLKNPLAIITMSGELLKEPIGDVSELESQQLWYLDKILGAADHMNTLVNDLLNLERIRRGADTIREPYDLAGLIYESALRQEPAIQQKGQTLNLDIPQPFPMLNGDVIHIKQVFDNLIGNANKYTPDGGRITISLRQQGSNALVAVEDTGYGISAEAQKKLFQEFYRVRTEATAHISGTGLGLSLVKTIVEQHRGRVWVKSQEGAGSTFNVELPLPPPE